MVNVLNKQSINIEVAYALPDKQWLIPLQVSFGTTVERAIKRSGILLQCPEIDLRQCVVGIFSKKVPLHSIVRDGDRIEIYRKLLMDPKEARKAKVLG